MAFRYTPDQLLYLRESPLAVRPLTLPPVEEWMGQPADTTRTRNTNTERVRGHDQNVLLDQNNRRPPVDRLISRGSANPEDIILGPPKTPFPSASARNRDSADKPPLPRSEDSRDRFNGIRKTTDTETERMRDSRGGLRPRRGDELDGEGWSTVKPRKSFGAEDHQQRFNGRMGGDRGGERHREDRRFKDREDRADRGTTDRPGRGFENFSRDKEIEPEQDGALRRNGIGRGRNEPSWFKDNNDTPSTPGERKSNGDRFSDKHRSWREKDERAADKERERGEERGDNRNDNRGDNRGNDRRWDRDRERQDRHQERDPEWMDEPADGRNEARTQEDFQKWKEQMKAGSSHTTKEENLSSYGGPDIGGQSSFFGLEKPKIDISTMVVDTGPDKFFASWSQPQAKVDDASDPEIASRKEGMTKAAATGKASRFTSFFTPKEEKSAPLEAPPPMPAPPQPEIEKEKQDFQRLLLKLQSQSMSLSSPTPPSESNVHPRPPPQDQASMTAQPHEQFQQYRQERQEPSRHSNRDSQQALQDLLLQRPSQAPSRNDSLLHEFASQRPNTISQSSSRTDTRLNSNTEFLMNLMQNARAPSAPVPSDPVMGRGPPPAPQADRHILQQQISEREQEQRERVAQRQRRPDVPPGFYEDNMFQRGHPTPHEPTSRNTGPPQPTQILQRPPPGLDQGPPGWNPQNPQLPPMPLMQSQQQPPQQQQQQQQRHVGPPPGLQGGRGLPPMGMFPPGFPMNGYGGPPPDGMGPPRNIGPPPPGFMMPPPPGFLGGPPLGFPGPESMAFPPYDGRGVPPPGSFRR